MPINDPIYYNRRETVPGTGKNLLGEALVGFAKGLASRSEEERKRKASNEQTAVQAMIQQEMITPTTEGKADFSALGYNWKYQPPKADLSTYNTASQIQDRELDMMIKTDPEAWLQKQLDSARVEYRYQVQAGLIDPDEVPESVYMLNKEQELKQRAASIGYLRPFADQSATLDKEPGTGKYAGKMLMKPKVHPQTGVKYYRVRDTKTGQEGVADEQELAANPNLERV